MDIYEILNERLRHMSLSSLIFIVLLCIAELKRRDYKI